MMRPTTSIISMMKRKTSNEPIKFVRKRSARFGGAEPDHSLNQVRNISDLLISSYPQQHH